MPALKYTTILDEKRLVEYLNKITPQHQDAAEALLNSIMFYSFLAVCLPSFPSEEHLFVTTTLASAEPEKITSWYTQQPQEIKQAITESFERLLFSLEAHI